MFVDRFSTRRLWRSSGDEGRRVAGEAASQGKLRHKASRVTREAASQGKPRHEARCVTGERDVLATTTPTHATPPLPDLPPMNPDDRNQAQSAPSTRPLAPRILVVLIYTLLPLGGVLFAGWDWREVLVLYWLENVALGVAMVVRILRTRRDPGPEAMIINDRRVAQTPGSIAFLAGFFALHYGIFTLVHGVFVALIVSGLFFDLPSTNAESPFDWPGVLIVFAIAGIAQVVIAAVGPLPPQRGTALMMSAYPRIIVLHVTVLGSIALIAEFGWPAITAVILIALHGIVDAVGLALSARRARASAPRR